MTQPKLLSDWAVQAGLLDRGIEVAEDDLEAAIALREAIYRTVTARLEGRRPKSADIELLNEHGSHAQLTPRLDRTGAVRRVGPHRSCSRAWWRVYSRPARRTRHREGQGLRPSGVQPPVCGFVARTKSALVRDGHLWQQGQSASVAGASAGLRIGGGRRRPEPDEGVAAPNSSH